MAEKVFAVMLLTTDCRTQSGAGGAQHGGEMPVDAHHLLRHQPASQQPDRPPAQVRGQKQWLCDKGRRGGIEELKWGSWEAFPKVWETAASKSKSRGQCLRFYGGVVSLFISARAGRWRNTSLNINPGIVWPSWLKCKFAGSNLTLLKSPYIDNYMTTWHDGIVVHSTLWKDSTFLEMKNTKP